MKPEIWGKYVWASFHLITLGYPINPTPKDKIHYATHINSMKYVLPCDKCNTNLKDHLKKYPLTDEALSTKSKLVQWGIDLHNIVNYYTGKSMMTNIDAMNELNKLVNPEKSKYSYNTMFWMIIGLILVIIIVGFLLKKIDFFK